MNTFEAINSRKSTRRYTTQPVEKEKLEQIVSAGNKAAIAGSLDFAVITNAAILDMIQKTAKAVMLKSGNDFLMMRANTPGFEVLYNAPAAIAVITEATNNPQSAGMNNANAGCAAQNMLLAATALNVSSCYTASSCLAFAVPDVKKAIGISEDKAVACIVALGYSEDDTPVRSRSDKNIKWCE